MDVTCRCIHCGRTVDAPHERAGGVVRCAGCGRELAPAGPAAPRDETLSRSMLLPLPNLGAGPPGEMIGRLEPGTLRWLDVSAALAGWLGGAINQLRGQSFLDVLHEDDRALAEDEFREAAEVGERHDFILRLRGGSGPWHYLRIHAQARYDPDGRLNHLRCHLKDVTDRVRAEQELRRRTEQLTAANEQLRRANRRLQEAQVQLVHSEKLAALGTLAAGMAHEINNPLAVATSNVAVLERDLGHLLDVLAAYHEGRDALRAARPDLAERVARLPDGADPAALRQDLTDLTRAARRGLARVAQIVQNLRDFAQLDRAAIVEIDVNQSLDQGLALLGDLLARQRVAVDRRYGPLPPLECAAAHLHQVFLNLLINGMEAIEATGRGGGSLRVETRHEAGTIVVAVADDGGGIAAEVLPRIFDPFFTTKPAGRGTGLGLSLALSVVAEHGGTIAVDTAAGVGSIFRVRLPVRRADRRRDRN